MRITVITLSILWGATSWGRGTPSMTTDSVDELGLSSGSQSAPTADNETASSARPLPSSHGSVRVQPAVKKKTRRPTRRRRRARRGFVQMRKSGPGYVLRDLRRSWGVALTIKRLEETFAAYHRRFPTAVPARVCDLSRRWGGRFRPHKSHRTGRDVDIKVVMKRPRTHWVRATPRTMHTERMWFLVHRLAASGDTQYIFLDRRLQGALYRYARSRGYTKQYLAPILSYPRRGGAIVRHWRGHADHIHVRFHRGS